MEYGIVSVDLEIPKIEIRQERVVLTLEKTLESSAYGIPVYYDSSYYDDGKYYNKWFSESGELKSTDTPVVKTIGDCVKISGIEDSMPRIKLNV
jgi:hypothetical protein